MLIIRNNVIPFKGYKCINVCGILFVRGDSVIDSVTLNHERIHTAQITEMLVIGFYLWYVVEYLITRLFNRRQNDAYHDVSFEEEANAHEDDEEYLKSRKHYAWFKYIKVNSYHHE